MTNNNNSQSEHKLSPTEEAIIEMMRNQNIAAATNIAAAASAGGGSSDSGAQPQQSLSQQLQSARDSSSSKNNNQKKHAFWDTQPMPHGDDFMADHPEGPVVPDKDQSEIRQEPYTMPTGFCWSNVNVDDPAERLELYNLLASNYVEDGECLFRFDYSQEFLLWALTPPDTNEQFLFGVRTSSNGKLVAFISAIPTTIMVYSKTTKVVEINFLCVHKKLRSKRLAPVLIKEITRRVNQTGCFQAVYTAGTVLPVPVSSARYYHRSLNPKKLVNVGFSRLPPRMTMARMNKLYKLPKETSTPGLRAMEKKDVEQVHELLNAYLTKFELKILFTKEEVDHWLLPRDKVINSYVVENPTTKKITDFLSFYHLPSSILSIYGEKHTDDDDVVDNNNNNKTLFAAYSFYNVATSISMTELMRDGLILAKQCGADVFNALDLMENGQFLSELKFGKGDGNLNYYIYNWACPKMPSENVGIVLL